MKNFKYLSALLILTLIVAACAPAVAPETAPQAEQESAAAAADTSTEESAAESEAMAEDDIVDTAIAAGDFETLVAAVQAAGLVDALKGDGPFTVFAPTDEAFAALPEGTIDALLEDPEGDLTQILLYHVISGKVMAADVSDGLMAETLQGAEVSFSISDDGAMINEANIIATDIETSNGVIHVIDAVILPPADEAAEADSDMADEAMTDDIVDTAIAAGSFETLVAAVQAAGLVDALKGDGPFTVFAPTDDAFAALPEGTIDALLEDPEGDLTQILLYHVISGKVMAADVSDGLMAETLQGAEVSFSISDDGAMINEANIIATDIETSNGVIHVIDAVILPPADEAAMGESDMADEAMTADIVDTAITAGSFETLVAAVQAAGLVDALKGDGPFTVFAPTDDAFAALPEGTVETLLEDPEGDLTQILLYHVIPGKIMAANVSDGLQAETLQGASVAFSISDDGAMINEANIIATDIETSNGVIHVIDAVILPPADEAAMGESDMSGEAMTDDIVDTAIAAGSFETLVAAVQAAGLVDALKGDGPFTVFAPTDEAFAALPEGTVEALLKDPEGDLTQILLYHVIPGKVMAADLSDGLMAETLQGSKLAFSLNGMEATVNGLSIIATDIETSNGVIHVIDAVLLPEGGKG